MSLIASLIPSPTPETRQYWEGLEQHELRLPRCSRCASHFFPPSNVCPRCSSRSIEWIKASGRATLYSYVINSRTPPEWEANGPMTVAHVVLEEGPSLVSIIVNCAPTPAALQFDMPLRAVFRDFGNAKVSALKMLCFEPANASRDYAALGENNL